MKKWVIVGTIAAFLFTLTGALVSQVKEAVILPKDPETVVIYNDVDSIL